MPWNPGVTSISLSYLSILITLSTRSPQSTCSTSGPSLSASSPLPSCSALPTSDVVDSPAQLAERQATQARVVYCERTYWAGACRIHVGNFGDCHNLGDDWNDKISSIRNDLGWGVACTWYEEVIFVSYLNPSCAPP